MKFLLIILITSLTTFASQAQYNLGFQLDPSGLTIIENGEERSAAAIGGLSTPQLSEIDLDFDGVADLFIFDRSNDIVRTYLYDGTLDGYVYAPQYESAFPADLKEFALLRDYDCDGHADIFTYYLAGYRVYRNNGSAPLGFTKVTDKIQSDYGSITTGAFVLAGDVPAIVDVDSDGDLDMLTFGTVNSENSIEFHRNLSQDLYNSCDSLAFEVVTQCWGNVEEPANASMLQPITCKGVVPPGRGEVHPGSSVLLIDTDADGDKDLIIGDIQTNQALFAVNIGDANSATIDVNQQTNDFPNAQDPVAMQYLVSGYEIDVDHDGKQDLIMSINNTVDSSVNDQHLWHYRDNGSTEKAYALQSKDFLLSEMLDIGSNVSVEVMDVNGDGDLDFLMSSDFLRTPTGGSKSRIFYFEHNDGSYELVDDNFAGILSFGFKAATLGLGDLDGDGDEDLLIGDLDGNLHYFRNEPIGGLANFILTEPEYQGINTIGANAAPEIADINGDGLLDLLIGERIGTVSYFENSGTASSPSFTSSATIEDMGEIDVSVACCVGHAQPRWIDNPALANGKHLMIGSDEKRIYFYRVPENLQDPFPLVDSLVINAGRLSPALADLDDDAIYELVTGTAEGGIRYFERDENVPIGIPQLSSIPVDVSLFPNPTAGKITLQMDASFLGTIHIVSLDGRTVSTHSIRGERKIELSLDQLPQGLYLLHFKNDQVQLTQRFLILH